MNTPKRKAPDSSPGSDATSVGNRITWCDSFYLCQEFRARYGLNNMSKNSNRYLRLRAVSNRTQFCFLWTVFNKNPP